MFNRRLLFWPAIAAAVAGPYVAMDESWSSRLSSAVRSVAREVPRQAAAAPPSSSGGWITEGREPRVESPSATDVAPQVFAADATPFGQASVLPIDMQAILRFDLTPAWITRQWPRVSTTVTDDSLRGLRVPLVTGTLPHDLAGSLTYYFDERNQMRRILFQGTTGDERHLIRLLTERFHLRPDPALGTGIYSARWGGQPWSVLQVQTAGVIQAEAIHSRTDVYFELNWPDRRFGLSAESRSLLTGE